MPRERIHLDSDQLVRLYVEERQSCSKIAEALGCDPGTVLKRLKSAGVRIRSHSETMRGRVGWRKIQLPSREIASAYLGGESPESIADWYGVTRTPINRVLRESGVKLRSMSRAQKTRWDSSPPDHAEKCCRPMQLACSKHEAEFLSSVLSQFSNRWERQWYAGDRALDFALPELSVAVELERKSSTGFNERGEGADRLEHFLDRGWFVLFVIGRESCPSLTDHVLAALQLACSDPSLLGQYGVVWRGLQEAARSRYQFYKRPVIEHLCGRYDSTDRPDR